ncbi:hypothetical protein ACQP1V_36310 [Microtetraspora malaysiensis]|uniref:phage terminase small subunit n=1 Tax=Microtetraspora malaysiensis TaxID=161358 RepID=UPI003D8EB411
MAGMGPPPNPNRRRRNAQPATLRLPAGGRQGETPPWPLPKAKSAVRARRELEVWAELWRTPQAAAWERLEWTRTVARYVRYLLAAEAGDSRIAAEVRQMEDRLGLNPMALLRLRWQIEDDQDAEVHELRPAASEGRRLRAVDPE